eukprot:CAMPEP_0197427576 /NCGR_PEP_ID=MMETSP1170-20131217/38724_1 /TAXON_ID=54406 /ORGANISM="Sarcinochrysis sp, Strain CCMP770" /LENGTH=73 /DNA_ID=CAMNT_0042955271 /DNA_START=46 /DNA_END=267 /DNA_ORIENTATION=-
MTAGTGSRDRNVGLGLESREDLGIEAAHVGQLTHGGNILFLMFCEIGEEEEVWTRADVSRGQESSELMFVEEE